MTMPSHPGVAGRTFSSLAVATLMAACAIAEPDAKKAIDRGSIQNARAAVGPCIIAPVRPVAASAAAGLGDLVAGAVVKEGLNLIGKALDEAGKQNVTKFVVSANVDSQTNLTDKCLQIVRGTFDENMTDAVTPPWVNMIGLTEEQYMQLRGNRLGTLKQPDFIFEAYFRRSGSTNTFSLSPTLVAFFNPVERRLLRLGTERDVSLEISFHGPNKKFDDATNPSARIHIGEMRSPILHFFQPPFPDKATPGESPWFTVLDSGPFTVTGAVFETESANSTLQFWAAVFKAVNTKEGLETNILQATLASERAKGRVAEQKADQELLKNFVDAFKLAIVGLNKCKETGSVADIADARILVGSANINAEAAGKSPPFKVKPSITDDLAMNKQTCANVAQQISGASW